MTFEVGDKVIYPNHGLGIVERIEDKTILGTTCGFYHLRIVANDTTVLVPVSNVDGVGLRRAISDEEVERLFRPARRRQDRQPPELEGPVQDTDKMRSGSIYEESPMCSRALTFLAKSKSLSFREKRMLDRAKFLSSRKCRSDARIGGVDRRPRRSRARRCFTVKARTAAPPRAKLAKRAAAVASNTAPRGAVRAS